MFTIDLLKGQGIPVRCRPESIVIAAITAGVPLIVAIVMFGFYLTDGIVISVQRQRADAYENKTGELSDAVDAQKLLEGEKKVYGRCLSEVGSALGGHTQWSSVLVTVVKNLPETVLMTDLEVRQDSEKRKVPDKEDPDQMVDIVVPVRTLHMAVSGSPQMNCDDAVRDFRERLLASNFLGPRLQNIEVSQEIGTLDGCEVVSYDIECIFKPGL